MGLKKGALLNRCWYIYALVDPRNEEVRYVGWTLNVTKRLQGHVSCSRTGAEKTHKSNWIKSLLEIGLSPRMDILESGSGDGWGEAETRWIQHYRDLSHSLTNIASGGEGTTGCTPSAETRQKLRDVMRSRVFSEEHRERISRAKTGVTSPSIKMAAAAAQAANYGRKQTDTEKELRASKLRGRKRSPEEITKTLLANTGKKRTTEQRQRISKSHIGINLGVKHSADTKAKISRARTGMKFSDSHRANISVAVREINLRRAKNRKGLFLPGMEPL